MKETKLISNGLFCKIYHIISEPGDKTLYDYLVYRDGPDEFCFMPARSTFRYPQRLNYYNVKNMIPIDTPPENTSEIPLMILASKEGCSIWTIVECIRTIKELHDGT